MTTPVLDLYFQKDEGSRNYNVARVLPAAKPIRNYTWRIDGWLDQGEEGACVGFWNGHDLLARPYVHYADYDLALRVYKLAQDLDGMPWTDGTSMLAGAKAMKQLGYIGEYRWSFTLEDALMALAYIGPIGLGINVYSGMWDTDANGFWVPSGQVVGGHAIIAYKLKIYWLPGTTLAQKRSTDWLQFVDLDKSYIKLRNSWGKTWGDSGDCKLSIRDFDRLRREDGEVVVYTKRF